MWASWTIQSGQSLTNGPERNFAHNEVTSYVAPKERRVIGHNATYYGISGNMRSIQRYYRQTLFMTHKWLNRRSQRKAFTWKGSLLIWTVTIRLSKAKLLTFRFRISLAPSPVSAAKRYNKLLSYPLTPNRLVAFAVASNRRRRQIYGPCMTASPTSEQLLCLSSFGRSSNTRHHASD